MFFAGRSQYTDGVKYNNWSQKFSSFLRENTLMLLADLCQD